MGDVMRQAKHITNIHTCAYVLADNAAKSGMRKLAGFDRWDDQTVRLKWPQMWVYINKCSLYAQHSNANQNLYERAGN